MGWIEKARCIMKLSTKLYLGFGLVLVLLIIISTWSIIYLIGNSKNMKLISLNDALMMSIKDKEVGHLDWLSRAEMALIDTTSRDLKVEVDPHKCKFGKWYYSNERIKAEIAIPEIQGSLKDIEQFHTMLHKSAIHINQALSEGNRAGANEIFKNETVSSLKKVREYLSTINDKVHETVISTEIASLASASNTKTVIIILCIIAVFIGSLSAFLIINGVMKQLGGEPHEVVRVAQSIADGDLTVDIDYNKNIQNSALAAMSKMTESLEGVISEIMGASHSLASAVDHISSGNQSLSQTTQEQASAIEEVAATIEEMTSSIKHSAENASDGRKKANEMVRMTSISGESAQHLINAMSDISNASKKSETLLPL
jgi:methyl-accepting chemotaxis protein